ncbi:hypothetical protein PybrP1_011438 [[Pythium] brassicae (nom. inval.)]|nr:hypothetical protein PybrP1_011438 [[Pythium] brassicae (nom. inval.)]
MLYGYLSGNIFPLFATCLGGIALSVVYLSVYFFYTTERARVGKQIAIVALWNSAVLVLSFSGEEFLGITSLSNKKTGNWVGYIATATSIMLYASPFATLRHVICTKSVETIPIEMVIVGWVTNAIWVLYAVLDSDEIVAITNAICVIFGCVQTVAYFAVMRQQQRPTRDAEKKETTGLSTVELDQLSMVFTEIREHAHGPFQPLRSPA